jgi:hypothetical protein
MNGTGKSALPVYIGTIFNYDQAPTNITGLRITEGSEEMVLE